MHQLNIHVETLFQIISKSVCYGPSPTTFEAGCPAEARAGEACQTTGKERAETDKRANTRRSLYVMCSRVSATRPKTSACGRPLRGCDCARSCRCRTSRIGTGGISSSVWRVHVSDPAQDLLKHSERDFLKGQFSVMGASTRPKMSPS